MKNNYLRLAILLMILVLLPDYFKIAGFIIILIYWIINTEKKYYCFVLIVLIPFLIDNVKPISNNLTGRVTDIKKSSFVVNNTVVYADSIDVNYDDIVRVEAEKISEFKKIKSKYAFDFSEYYHARNIHYYCFSDDIVILNQSKSLRGKVYGYINNFDCSEVKSFYKMIIFNISDDNNNFIIVHGLYFSGIFWCINYLLKWFIDKETIKYIDVINCLLFCCFYHFPLILLRLLIKKILLLTDLNSKDRLGIMIIILLSINYSYIYSLGFIFPVSFYFVSIFHKDDKILFYLNSMVIQSLYLYEFNIIQVITYKYLMRFSGLIYLISIILLPFNKYSLILSKLLNFADMMLNNNFSIYGKPAFIVFLIMYLIYKNAGKSKFRYYYLTVTYILLMFLNVSHIYASVSFINVEQGDSILIRLPYNKGNILVDTGKESKYNYLDSYLKATGIKELNYLIITHDDSDHNGNLNNLIKDYKIDNIITNKKIDVIINDFKMISLNNKEYDNDNDNSLVYYFMINDISFLLTGDISKKVERNIIREYPEISADILKLSHHGSKTGSDSTFLKLLDPEIAVISSGDTYNHPHKEVLNELENNHIVYFLTKENCDIEFIFTKIFNIIKLWHKDFVIIDNRW